MEDGLKKELEKMVDVCAGKITIKELNGEIINYMFKSPQLIVITIERKPTREEGYYSTIYLTKEDFEKKC